VQIKKKKIKQKIRIEAENKRQYYIQHQYLNIFEKKNSRISTKKFRYGIRGTIWL